ncbi:MAG: menaquinone biosynthesis protein [Planctomycetota bacterium]|nr:menaquinone biosynthesis protein [Planctomycetota bacterium]
MAGLRVGAVNYLNAKPLYYNLGDFAPGTFLCLDYPSKLADRLARGELDVALIPSVEYLRGAAFGYEILPGFAIAARGPVRSVKLFSNVPIERIDRLALDAGSRTSQALALVWLDQARGVRPGRVEPLPLGVPVEESTADAALVIGDRAMLVDESRFDAVVDLGEAWNTWTGLPFVFALWVARPGVDLGDLPEVLERCRLEGLRNARVLAEEHAPRLGLNLESCVDYLTRVLSYDLGPREIAGLRQFATRAARQGLAPEGVELVFHERRRHLAAGR